MSTLKIKLIRCKANQKKKKKEREQQINQLLNLNVALVDTQRLEGSAVCQNPTINQFKVDI